MSLSSVLPLKDNLHQSLKRLFKQRALFLEGIIVGSGKIFTALGLLAGMRLLTELVPPEIFGSISLLIGVMTLGYGVCCVPFIQAFSRFFPDVESTGNIQTLRFVVRRRLLQANILAISLILLGGLFFTGSGNVTIWICILLAFLLVIESWKRLGLTILNAQRRQSMFAMWNTSEVWCRFGIAGFVVWLTTASIEHVLFGYLLGSGTVMLFFWFLLQRSLSKASDSPNITPPRDLDRDIWTFSRPLMPIALAGWVSGLSDRYIIGGLLGMEQAGIYAAVYGLISCPFIIMSSAVELTLRPHYYRFISSGDENKGNLTLYFWLSLNFLGSAIGFLSIYFWSDAIIKMFLGQAYHSGAFLAPWVAGGYCFFSLARAVEKKAYALKNTTGVFKMQIAGAVASVCIALPATYFYGLLGAAYAVPIYFAVQLLLTIYWSKMSKKEKPISFPCPQPSVTTI